MLLYMYRHIKLRQHIHYAHMKYAHVHVLVTVEGTIYRVDKQCTHTYAMLHMYT